MPQWSIGVCTPIPMVPVDSGAIVKEKLAQAKAYLDGDAGNIETARRLLTEAVDPPKDPAQHLGLITPEWQRARTNLAIPMGHANIEIFADGMEVGLARCAAANAARENGLKWLFFIDWDTIIPPDALMKLVYHLENNPDYDVASGMYCLKSVPTFPLLWREWNQGVDFDWTMGDVLYDRVVGIGMGCALIRVSCFDKLPQPWFKTVNEPVFCGGQYGRMMMTEDLYFTKALTDRGGKILVDTSIMADHICHATGRRYHMGDDSLPVKRARERGLLA